MFVCVQYVAIGDSVKFLFIYWTSESNIGILKMSLDDITVHFIYISTKENVL